MFLIVGLGNPGAEYAQTRHNIGFMAVDALADQQDTPLSWQKKHKSECCKVDLDGHPALLLKPQTYMNLSGQAVHAAMAFHKIPPEHTIVIYDEIDLNPGQCRIKHGGGHNGHNGLKSIDQAIGKNYWRVRLGVGRPDHPDLPVDRYVLSRFDKEQQPVIENTVSALANHFKLLLSDDPAALMNKIALNQT